ncbi:MAG TPA: PadR family transcriptional regulator [Anaerolineaceae bacterium]|nr:MAG: PadR family transcriptional regulator [Chloroflexi bacterium GWB2_54_36]HAL16096.1 PadR family transcriptional regulator [Anaerolineaceae bacterium]
MSVRNALLGLLAQRPFYGYELLAALDGIAGGHDGWAINPGQIYATLERLEKSGLIAEQPANGSAPEKTTYTATVAGRQELAEWLSAPVQTNLQRDEFYIKLMLALSLEGTDPYRVIQIQRASLYQELHAVTTHRDSLDLPSGLAQKLLFDKAVMHLEADLRWLEMIETRLDDVKRQPVQQVEMRPRGRPPKSARGAKSPPQTDKP